MATFSLATQTAGQSFFSAPSGFYCIAKTPTTWRRAADGVRYGLTLSMNPSMASQSGTTSSRVYVASASGSGAAYSSSFSVAAASSAAYQGNKAVTRLLQGGANYRFGYTQTGTLLVGRGGTGRVYRLDTGAETSWATQLVITITVAEVPGAPTNVALTPSGSSIDVTWDAPASDGGSAITGYVIEWSDDPLFTTYESLVVPTNSGTIDASGLTYVRVGAINAVATAAGTSGPYSETQSGTATETPQGSFVALAFDSDGVLYAGFSGEPYVVQYNIDQGSPTARWYPVTSSGADLTFVHQLSGAGLNESGQPQVMGAFTGTPRLTFGAVQTYPVAPATLESAIREYVGLIDPTIPIVYEATHNPDVSIPAWTNDVWVMLNQLCAAHSVELSILNNAIRVRDCAVSQIDVDDKLNISRSASLQSASQYVTVGWTGAHSGGGVIYDGSSDDRVYSVAAGETLTDVITTENSPAFVSPLVRTAIVPVGDSSYLVTDSTGVTVPLGLFEQGGGDVSVIPVEGVPGVAELTFTAPTFDLEGYPGPYRMAYPTQDGTAGTVPALRISGSGVFLSRGSERIYTGAAPESTSREEGVDVDSPFIESRAHAYNTGVWTAAKASGSWPTVSFTLSSKDCEGFGLTSGSLFISHQCVYRITSSTVTRSGVVVTAEFHATAQEFENRWEGQTAQMFEDYWDGYVARDLPLRPLR